MINIFCPRNRGKCFCCLTLLLQRKSTIFLSCENLFLQALWNLLLGCVAVFFSRSFRKAADERQRSQTISFPREKKESISFTPSFLSKGPPPPFPSLVRVLVALVSFCYRLMSLVADSAAWGHTFSTWRLEPVLLRNIGLTEVIFFRAAVEENAYNRLKKVVKWYISGFYKKPKVSLAHSLIPGFLFTAS